MDKKAFINGLKEFIKKSETISTPNLSAMAGSPSIGSGIKSFGANAALLTLLSAAMEMGLPYLYKGVNKVFPNLIPENNVTFDFSPELKDSFQKLYSVSQTPVSNNLIDQIGTPAGLATLGALGYGGYKLHNFFNKSKEDDETELKKLKNFMEKDSYSNEDKMADLSWLKGINKTINPFGYFGVKFGENLSRNWKNPISQTLGETMIKTATEPNMFYKYIPGTSEWNQNAKNVIWSGVKPFVDPLISYGKSEIRKEVAPYLAVSSLIGPMIYDYGKSLFFPDNNKGFDATAFKTGLESQLPNRLWEWKSH